MFCAGRSALVVVTTSISRGQNHQVQLIFMPKWVSLISTQLAAKAQSSQNDLLAFNLSNEIILLLLSSGKKLNVNIALGKIFS